MGITHIQIIKWQKRNWINQKGRSNTTSPALGNSIWAGIYRSTFGQENSISLPHTKVQDQAPSPIGHRIAAPKTASSWHNLQRGRRRIFTWQKQKQAERSPNSSSKVFTKVPYPIPKGKALTTQLSKASLHKAALGGFLSTWNLQRTKDSNHTTEIPGRVSWNVLVYKLDQVASQPRFCAQLLITLLQASCGNIFATLIFILPTNSNI